RAVLSASSVCAVVLSGCNPVLNIERVASRRRTPPPVDEDREEDRRRFSGLARRPVPAPRARGVGGTGRGNLVPNGPDGVTPPAKVWQRAARPRTGEGPCTGERDDEAVGPRIVASRRMSVLEPVRARPTGAHRGGRAGSPPDSRRPGARTRRYGRSRPPRWPDAPNRALAPHALPSHRA